MKSIRLTRSDLIVFLILNLIIVFFYTTIGLIDNYILLFSNYIILFISSAGVLFKAKQYYSLSKFFYLFSFFFFGIVPYLDYATNNYYWGGTQIDDYYFFITNIIIILGLIFYFFEYVFSKNDEINQISLQKEKKYFLSLQKNILLISILLLIISLIASYLILLKNDYNVLLMLVRGAIDENISMQFMSKIEFLVFNYIITPIPVTVLLIYGYVSYGNKVIYKKLFLIILFILAVFFVAPTSVARFLAITLYLAILLRFMQILEKRYLFQLSSIFGLMIIMPFLDKFRHFDKNNFKFSIDFNFLSAGHFDAYQNFARLVSIDYISYGNQLLGSLLFFVPRSLWIDKPTGSGNFLASLTNLHFDNISMPFIGEGYINFSIFGSLIFMLFLGFISGKLDSYYWSLKKHLNNHWFFNIYYLLLGMSFFILRGDLMSSFAYTVAVVGTYISIMYFLYIVSILKIRD